MDSQKIINVTKNNESIHYRKGILIGFYLLMTLYRAFIFFGFRGTNCPSIGLIPISSCEWYNVTFEMMLWGIVLILFIVELIWDHDFKPFFAICKKLWPVFIFIFLAAASISWSVLPQITLYKVSVLIICSLMAIYTGYVLGIRRFLDMLFWFFTILSLANLLFILLFPQASKWGGANLWNGVFWHKIYMGAFMALAITIYTLKLLDWKTLSPFKRVANILMLLITTFLLIKSGSVTGLIATAFMVTLCLTIAGWIRWKKYLKPVHYYTILGVAITSIVLIVLNHDYIFKLIGRSPSLSGRIPMWTYLFQYAIKHRPLFGYGYGAFWNLEGFREQMTAAMGFSLQVSQSDNGLMEILLHLGSVGLIIMLILIVLGFMRSIQYFHTNHNVITALPLILLVYAIMVNITVSMLLETDAFIWTILLASQAAICTSTSSAHQRLSKKTVE